MALAEEDKKILMPLLIGIAGHAGTRIIDNGEASSRSGKRHSSCRANHKLHYAEPENGMLHQVIRPVFSVHIVSLNRLPSMAARKDSHSSRSALPGSFPALPETAVPFRLEVRGAGTAAVFSRI